MVAKSPANADILAQLTEGLNLNGVVVSETDDATTAGTVVPSRKSAPHVADFDQAKHQLETLLRSMQVAMDRLLNALANTHGKSHAMLEKQETVLRHYMVVVSNHLKTHPAEGCHSLPLMLPPSLTNLMHALLAYEEGISAHATCSPHAFAPHMADFDPSTPDYVHATVLDGIDLQDEGWDVKDSVEDVALAAMLAQAETAPDGAAIVASVNTRLRNRAAKRAAHVVPVSNMPVAAAQQKLQTEAEKEFIRHQQMVRDMAIRLHTSGESAEHLFHEHVVARMEHYKHHAETFVAEHPGVSTPQSTATILHEVEAMNHTIHKAEEALAQTHNLGAVAQELQAESQEIKPHCSACGTLIGTSLIKHVIKELQGWSHSRGFAPGDDSRQHRK